MPEYLAPGVYVEEVSFRSKSIEGVSTSVAGFVGPTLFGPVGGTPELLTSFSDFSRIYGGIDDLVYGGSQVTNQVAHAVRAFFDNGGARLYVTRVYEPTGAGGAPPGPDDGKASSPLADGTVLRARFPGRVGNMRITVSVRPSANVLASRDGVNVLTGVRDGDVVYVASGSPPAVTAGLYQVVDDPTTGRQLEGPAADPTSPPTAMATTALSTLTAGSDRVHLVGITIAVRRLGRFEDEVVWDELSPTPGRRRSIPDMFTESPGSRADYLSIPFQLETDATSGAQILYSLVGSAVVGHLGDDPPAGSDDLQVSYWLQGGSDGVRPPSTAYVGEDDSDVKTGLKTFEDIDEISIVAAPGATSDYGVNQVSADGVVQALLTHCQIRMKYRVAVLESPDDQILSEVRTFRSKFDSTHAALYYPWVTVVDPLDPEGRRELEVAPAGFVAGIYARTDILHGVFKAPANEVALGAIDFERILNKGEQDVLNPLGINCFRYFEGRGFRLWGARTISSDPEWKYISVRRYFAYLEHSIDRGTQWAVFENNSDPLWNNVRRTVEDFLLNEWRNGALLGTKPEEAFFVRCDRSTMTQNDLDNGRLVCLIGVAVVKPAEFVIFRIGQMTADSKR